MRVAIYDCEIKKGILKKSETAIPNIAYCKGWRDYENMGVSVTGVYDSGEDRYRVFCDDNVTEMMALFQAVDVMVSFNGLGFDDPLLLATYPQFEEIDTCRYDLLAEIWLAAGLPPKWSGSSHNGYGLDDMCARNFNQRKSGHGAMAPVQWQRGEIGSVIDYCLWDVGLTKLLFDHALNNIALLSPKPGEDGVTLALRNPFDVFGDWEDERVDVQTVKTGLRTDQSAAPPPSFRDVHGRDKNRLPDEEQLTATGDGQGHDPNYQQGKLPRGESEEPEREVVFVDDLRREQASKTLPSEPSGNPHDWDNLLIEVEPLTKEEKYMVAIHTNDGLLIKRKLSLSEWSNLNDVFISKDGPTLVDELFKHQKLYESIGDDSGTA